MKGLSYCAFVLLTKLVPDLAHVHKQCNNKKQSQVQESGEETLQKPIGNEKLSVRSKYSKSHP